MTASTVSATVRPAGRDATAHRLTGLGPLFRKELGEWRHGVRVWVIVAVTALFMTLAAGNAALNAWIVSVAPEAAPDKPLSMAPVDNMLAAISSQIFVIAAIFAAMSLLVAERERGSLAWVASKPVSRGAIWVAKWFAAAVVVSIAAGILPLVATFIVATVLYGMPAAGASLIMAAGIVAAITFIVAVVLAASTVISNQPAVAAIGFAVVFLPQIIVGLLPGDIGSFLPTSILPWSIGAALGADVGFATPVAFLVSTVALIAFAIRRMDSLEL